MIVVFGSLNVDVVMPVDRFPNVGETVLCVADYASRQGGKGANQAVAAARAGAKVAMVGKVGDDSFGRRSVNNLKNMGIWTSGIGTSDRPTGCATIAVDRSGNNFVMVAPGANLDAASDQMPDEVFNAKNVILTQMELSPQETYSVLARAKERGAISILNASPAAELPEAVLKTLNYLIMNEIEAKQMAKSFGLSEQDSAGIAHALCARSGGQITVIVTLEERGSVAVSSEGIFVQPALAVEVVDSTGAGDAFCGIFAAFLQAGHKWLSALQHASAGASLACLGLGAQEGMPYLEAIQEAVKKVSPPQKIT